jgi:two-component system, sensor histidine kinase RegB
MNDTISQNTNRKNLLQLLWLRINAIFGQVVTILFVHNFLEISLPLTSMFAVVLILIILSCASFYRYKFQKNISDKSLFFELLFDVAALTAQLYFSGGISNPFISLFLLQVIISAILLHRIYAIIITLITIGCYISLSSHYQELHALHHQNDSDSFNLHLHGMLISYVFAAILLLIFITKIIRNLNERDQKISLLKQQSLEKEQVIRMGLLATSAAHELSTPLSTISVILGDWKKMNLEKDLIKDVNLVELQLARCKKILSEILFSSGQERAEKARIANVEDGFNDLVNEWKTLRKPKNLIYNFKNKTEQKIIFDNILSHSFFSIFDNALEASPDWISIEVTASTSEATVVVTDRGKGFDEEVLKEIGKPNLTTKNGNGLGLFLALNSLNRLGGSLKISNLSSGGAKVEAIIPFKNL